MHTFIFNTYLINNDCTFLTSVREIIITSTHEIICTLLCKFKKYSFIGRWCIVKLILHLPFCLYFISIPGQNKTKQKVIKHSFQFSSTNESTNHQLTLKVWLKQSLSISNWPRSNKSITNPSSKPTSRILGAPDP